MQDLRLGRKANDLAGNQPATMAERELFAFVNSVANLFGSEHRSLLAEIWLDELASMDSMPAPTSCEWRMVSVAAWARLASRFMCLDSRSMPF